MGIDASIWIPIAFGALTGALLGLHEERLEAMPRGASVRPVISVARASRERPTFVQVSSVPPRPPISMESPSPATPEVSAKPAVSPPKAARPTLAKRKTTHARPVPRAPIPPKADDGSADEELTDAAAVFRAETACARQDPKQCLRAARAFRLGIAVPPNPRSASIYWHSALRIYEEGCKRRDPLSCVGQAAMYETGGGEQPVRAPDLLERARVLCSDHYTADCEEIDTETEALRALVEAPDGSSATTLPPNAGQ